MATRADELPLGVSIPTTADLIPIRRAALSGLLGSKLIGGWGVQWDIQPMAPGMAETVLAFLLVLGGGLAGGVAARWLSDALAAPGEHAEPAR